MVVKCGGYKPPGAIKKGGPHRPILAVDMAGMVQPKTIKKQVQKYLERLRFTLPIPVPVEEIYFGCMPDAVKQWYRSGIFTEAQKLGPVSNMLSALSRVRNENHEVLHLCLDAPEHYLKAMDNGQLAFEKVFWIFTDPDLPGPGDSKTKPLFIPDTHPHRAAIQSWHQQAMELEDDIQEMLKVVEQYTRLANSAAAVRHTWPDLMNFVNAPTAAKGLSHAERESLKTRAAQVMAPTDKARIIERLSTAAMIPETVVKPLAAWVGFFTMEFKPYAT